MQRTLLARGQVVTYFSDIAPVGFAGFDHQPPGLSAAAQFWGARGFFSHYAARPEDPLTQGEARRWAWLTRRAADPWRPLAVDAGIFNDQTPCRWSEFVDILRDWMADPSPLRMSMGALPNPSTPADPEATISRGEACWLIDRLYSGGLA